MVSLRRTSGVACFLTQMKVSFPSFLSHIFLTGVGNLGLGKILLMSLALKIVSLIGNYCFYDQFLSYF